MYFAEPVIFEIPVRPHVKKFIRAKLRDEQGRPTPLIVSSDSEGASLMLWALAQSEKVLLQMGWRYRKNIVKEQADSSGRLIAPADMTERLGLGICEFHRTRHEYLLNYAELETFHQWVDYIILNELVTYCETAPDVAPMVRIKAFCDLYDFAPEDLPEDTMKKMYQRHRNGTGGFHFNRRWSQVQHFQPIHRAEAA